MENTFKKLSLGAEVQRFHYQKPSLIIVRKTGKTKYSIRDLFNSVVILD
jgi:hypothetical protein